MSEDFSEFDSPEQAADDFSEFDEPQDDSAGPPLSAASPEAQALEKLRSGQKLGTEEVLSLSRYLKASEAMSQPAKPRDALRELNAYGLNAATMGALTGNIGEKIFGKIGVEQARRDVGAFEHEQPWYVKVPTAMASAAPIGVLTPNTLIGSTAVGALGGALGSRSDDASGYANDIGKGAAFGAAGYGLGRLAGKAVDAFLRPAKTAGAALQAPQMAVDKAADKIGGTKVAQMIAGDNVKPPSGVLASQRIKDLQKVINAGDPDFGAAVAETMSEAERNLGSAASTPISLLSDADKRQVAGSMADLLKQRGAAGITPERIMSSWDDLVTRFAGSADATPLDMLKGVNKRDVKWLASAAGNIEETNRVLGLTDEVIPDVKGMFGGARGAREAAATDRMTRFGQSKLPKDPTGKYLVDISKVAPEEQLAHRLALAQLAGRADISPSSWSINPAEFGNDLAELQSKEISAAASRHFPDIDQSATGKGVGIFDEIKNRVSKAQLSGDTSRMMDVMGAQGALKRDLAVSIPDAERDLFTKASQIAEQMKLSQAAAAEQAQLKQAADTARTELQRIATGRRALETGIGAIGGAGAGSGFGLFGTAIGLATGKQIGKGALSTIDFAGAIGQRLANTASWAERIAAGQGPAAAAAKWALSGDAAGGMSQAVRLAIIAQMPEVQEEIGTDR